MADMNVADATTPQSASFRIFSGQLTPVSSGDGKRRLRTIASSSVEDLSGDVVTHNALQQMAQSAKGMTIFRNHSYKVPQDILGTTEAAEVRQSGVDGYNKPIYDLVLDIAVLDSPENDKTWQAVEAGVQLGTSIGAMIPNGSVRRGDNGGNIFDDLRLLEASIVGIPQNPRSWVQYAMKALKVAGQIEDDEDEAPNAGFLSANEDQADVEKGTAWVEATSDGGVKVTIQTDPPAEPETTDAEGDTKKGADSEISVGEDDPEVVTTAEVEIQSGLTDGDDLTELASDEPAAEAGEDDPVEGSETPAQEVGETGPESAETVEGDGDLLNETITRSADVLADLVKTMTRERIVLAQKMADTERERDAAIQRADDAEANLRIAKEIVQQIANSPLGRKAVFRDAVDDFATRLSGVYSPSILKMLEKHDD